MTRGPILKRLLRCEKFTSDFVNLYMTTIQLKTEIQKELDLVSVDALQDVLEYIKQIQHRSPEQLKRYRNFKKILAEDDKLFERLAK